MSHEDDIRNKKLRGMMPGLLIECPFGGNPSDCVLHFLRKSPIADRLKWLDEISDDELNRFYRCHLECLRKYEAEILPNKLDKG